MQYSVTLGLMSYCQNSTTWFRLSVVSALLWTATDVDLLSQLALAYSVVCCLSDHGIVVCLGSRCGQPLFSSHDREVFYLSSSSGLGASCALFCRNSGAVAVSVSRFESSGSHYVYTYSSLVQLTSPRNVFCFHDLSVRAEGT